MGVQFLREHVVPEARIHYAITNTGGYSPNVVQPYAEVLYLIRAPKNKQVEEIYRRVNKIAEGAAHMTETRVEIDFVKGCSNLVSNKGDSQRSCGKTSRSLARRSIQRKKWSWPRPSTTAWEKAAMSPLKRWRRPVE